MREDAFPHAETSAAGAARYDRLRGRGGAVDGDSSAAVAAPTTIREAAKHRSRARPAFVFRAPKDYVALDRRYRDWQSKRGRLDIDATPVVDIGWQTPAEMAYAQRLSDRRGGASHRDSLLSPWERDAELVRRSLWRDALMELFEDIKEKQRQLEDGGNVGAIEPQLVHEVHGLTRAFFKLLPSQDGERDAASNPNVESSSRVLFPADVTAFHIVGTMLLQAQIMAHFPDDKIRSALKELKKRVWSLSLPMYHRLVATAGRLNRPSIVEILFTYAYNTWQKSTDEWMLYARARAYSALPGGSMKKLTGYWKAYNDQKVAPAQAYGISAHLNVDDDRALYPPRYLFTFIFKKQLEHQRGFPRPRLQNALLTLRAMAQHGYKVDDAIWLLALKNSPSLRLQLPELISRATAKDGDEQVTDSNSLSRKRHLSVQAQSILFQLLRNRAHALDVRDVYRILRLMGVQVAKKHSTKGSGDADECTSRTCIVEPVRALQALAILAQMLGRMGRPENARDIYERCVALSDVDVDQQAAGMAATGVMSGYDAIGRPDLALRFGKELSLTPTTYIVGTMLRSAAALAEREKAVHEALSLRCKSARLDLPFDTEIARGLASFFFALTQRERQDPGGLRMLVRHLTSLYKGRPIRRGGSTNGKSLGLSTKREKAKRLLYALRALGVEERLSTREKVFTRQRMRHSDDDDGDINNGQSNRQDDSDAAAWVSQSDSLVQQDLDAGARGKGGDDGQQLDHGGYHRHDDAESANRLSTASGYLMRLRVLAVMERDHRRAARVLHDMVKRGVRPTMMHFAPLVEGLCLDGRVDEAIELIESARAQLGVLPSARSETALLRALLALGRRSDATRRLQDWRAAGGVADDYMLSLLGDNPAPTLATADGLTAALRRVDETGTPLDLRAVDQAYRWLMYNHMPKSAHLLILEAHRTGMGTDYVLRRAIRQAGLWLRRMYERMSGSGGTSSSTSAPLASSSPISSPSPTRRWSVSTFRGSHSEESSLEAVGEALRLQKEALQQFNQRSNAMVARDLKARDAHRRALREMVDEWVTDSGSSGLMREKYSGRSAFPGTSASTRAQASSKRLTKGRRGVQPQTRRRNLRERRAAEAKQAASVAATSSTYRAWSSSPCDGSCVPTRPATRDHGRNRRQAGRRGVHAHVGVDVNLEQHQKRGEYSIEV